MILRDFIPTYEKRHIKHLKPSSQAAQWQIINKTILPIFGDMELRDINRAHAQDLHDHVTDTLENSNRTSNEHLGVLSTILKCALEAMKIDVMPPLKRLPKGPQEDHKYLSQAQVDKLLLVAPKGIIRDLIYIAVNTGLRIGELRMLHWADISDDFETIRVSRSLDGRNDNIDHMVSVKGKDIRTIFLDEEMQRILKRQERVSPCIFTDPSDRTHKRQFLSYKFCHENGIVKAMTAAGVWQPEFGFHTLRHTFACLAAADETNPFKLQRILGHRHIATTMRYVEMFDKDLKDTAHKLSGRFKIE